MKKEFENIFFVVEASRCEHSMLWADWAKDSIEAKQDRKLLNWDGNASGVMLQIGEIDNRPITVQFTFDTIEGANIVFYNGCSQLVDHAMIRKWLNENVLHELDHRANHTDAMNFAHCVHAIEKYACGIVNDKNIYH